MQVFQVLHQVGTQAVPVVGGEERHMVHVDTFGRLEEHTHQGLAVGHLRLERGGVFLPVAAAHGDALAGHYLIARVDEFHAYAGIGRRGHMLAGIDGEVVAQPFLDAHTEETAVLQTGALLDVAGVAEHHIVGVAVEGGAYVAHRHIAEGVPSHQGLRKLERAVDYHLGIKTTVGTEVDVLKEDAIHGGLDGSPHLLGLHSKLSLCGDTTAQGKESEEEGRNRQFSHCL